MYRPPQEGKQLVQNGWLVDLPDLTKDSAFDWQDIQDGPRGTVTIDNKVYGTPIVTEREILYYRKSLLQQKGIESKFLFFPDENHWVLKPQNSVLWHDTVNAWLKQHIGQ